jgi:hypothetical protein
MPRLDVAVFGRDGSAVLVNANRPAGLIAFSDAHDGKAFPDTPREIAWIVHRQLGVDTPFEEWLETLEEISPAPADLILARKIIRGETTLEAEHERELAELEAGEQELTAAATPAAPAPELEPEPEQDPREPPASSAASNGGTSEPVVTAGGSSSPA